MKPAFVMNLKRKGYHIKDRLNCPFYYDGRKFDEGMRLDVFVDDLIVCELKSRESINPLWSAQLISHLRLTKSRLGYLINFNVPFIKDGIKRFIV